MLETQSNGMDQSITLLVVHIINLAPVKAFLKNLKFLILRQADLTSTAANSDDDESETESEIWGDSENEDQNHHIVLINTEEANVCWKYSVIIFCRSYSLVYKDPPAPPIIQDSASIHRWLAILFAPTWNN